MNKSGNKVGGRHAGRKAIAGLVLAVGALLAGPVSAAHAASLSRSTEGASMSGSTSFRNGYAYLNATLKDKLPDGSCVYVLTSWTVYSTDSLGQVTWQPGLSDRTDLCGSGKSVSVEDRGDPVGKNPTKIQISTKVCRNRNNARDNCSSPYIETFSY
jgi:hypothetical protein